MAILVLKDIEKSYDGHIANRGIHLQVPEGIIFGLLGPNGAGKTTLIRIITQIIGADRGEIWFQNEPFHRRHHALIGYMPEERGLYKKMKVGEHLIYLARLKQIPLQDARKKVEYWLDRFQLSDWTNKRIEELSKGMQQKVQFIATIIHNPKLLILDEPFSGLDPINSQLIKEEIFQLNQQGTTIIFSTHRMEQVEEICEEIALINKGTNILSGKVKDIRRQFRLHEYAVSLEGNVDSIQWPSHYAIRKTGEQQWVIAPGESVSGHAILSFLLQQSSITITSFKELLPSIHDIFIQQVAQSNHA